MARQATIEGTRQRLLFVRTAIYNLERDLYIAGEDVSPFTEFNPEEIVVDQVLVE